MADDGFKSYRDLRIWQDAMTLSVACYQLTQSFPKDEMYGMTSQIRRSAVSIAANIAEGHGRENTGSFIQFLRIAQGSLKELETHLILSERVRLASTGPIDDAVVSCEALGRQIRALIRSLQRKVAEG